MGFSVNGLVPECTEKYITARAASEFSGYNQQYLRRLLRKGFFKTRKIGQIWLIDHSDFIEHLFEAKHTNDKRFGPQEFQK